MASLQEAIDRVSSYLANRESLESFEDWSADYLQAAYRSGDDAALGKAVLIRAILNAYEDDSSDTVMRGELANTIRPFVMRAPVTSITYVYREPLEGFRRVLGDGNSTSVQDVNSAWMEQIANASNNATCRIPPAESALWNPSQAESANSSMVPILAPQM